MSRPDVKYFENVTCSEDEMHPLLYHVDYFGKMLLKTLKWLGISLVIVQLLLHIDGIRPILSPVYRMEGVPIDVLNVKDWMDEKKPTFLHHSS